MLNYFASIVVIEAKVEVGYLHTLNDNPAPFYNFFIHLFFMPFFAEKLSKDELYSKK